MITLPPDAVMVERNVEQNISSLIGITKEKINSGTIVFTGENNQKHQLKNVVFRESFVEEIFIDKVEYVYIRDLNSAMYYIRD